MAGTWRSNLLNKAVTLILLSSLVDSTQRLTGRGTDFFLAFPIHSTGLGVDIDSLSLSLVISNPTDSPVDVQILFPKMTWLESKSETLSAGQSLRLVLDNSLQLEESSKQGKGVCIQASDTVEVHVNSDFNANIGYSNGAYMALPRPSLSNLYVIATHCDPSRCFCTVVMTENSTEVNIHLRIKVKGIVIYNGANFFDNDIITESGDVGDVIQITCMECDLSGTMVSSSHRVAVLAGGQFTKIDPASQKDQVVTQFLPWENFGNYYIIGHDVAYSPNVEVVKVVTYGVDTSFFYDSVWYTSTEARQTFQFQRAPSVLLNITSTDNILLARFMEPQDLGDAVMHVPRPVSAWTEDEYNVFVYGNDWSVIHLVLIIDSKNVKKFKLDGEESTLTAQFGTSVALLDGEYLEATYVLPTGKSYALDVRCEKSSKKCGRFFGYVYSFSNFRAGTFNLMSALQSNFSSTTPDTTITDETTASEITSSGTTDPETTSTETISSETTTSGTAAQSTTETTTPSTTETTTPSTTETTTLGTKETTTPSTTETTTPSTTETTTPSTSETTTLRTKETTTPTARGTKTTTARTIETTTLSTTETTTSSTTETTTPKTTETTTPRTTEAISIRMTKTATPRTTEITTIRTIETTIPSTTETTKITTPSTTETTTASSTPTETITVTSFSERKWCSCRCSQRPDNKEKSKELQQAQEEVTEIKQDLILEAKKLSQKRRQKTSAEDNRPSSKFMGMTAIVILIISGLIFLCSDIFNCVHRALAK